MFKKKTFPKRILGLMEITIVLIAMGSTMAIASLNDGYIQPDDPGHASAIINNGLIQMGVNDQGHLNVFSATVPPSSGTGTRYVGLRYMPTNMEATAPGCLCEGWGAGDSSSGVTGYANIAVGGIVNMGIIGFTSTASTATSVVKIPNSASPVLEVTHYYHPSKTLNLYQVNVSVKNVGTNTVNLKYRRVMDWDVEPTAFREHVTIVEGTATDLEKTTTNGFDTANPLSPPSLLGGFVYGPVHDAGPKDHGALFNFNFGSLAPGETKDFVTYYGAAANEAEALAAIGAVGAEAYSLGQTYTDPATGTPNTFIFAFGGIGGTPVEPDPSIPEFPTVALPIMSVLGIMFLMSRKKHN